MRDLVDLLADARGHGGTRIFGVVTGVVTNNQDPDKLGRVRVRFPWLAPDGDGESWWARIAVPMAGKDTGVYFLPDVDDQVLVAFDQGDVRFPYVLGALWTSKRTPPETVDQQNTKRTIKSRSGHKITFDDSSDAEKIEIIDAKQKVTIVIDSSKSTISIRADQDVSVESANGKLTLSGKSVEVASQESLTLNAIGDLKLESDAKASLNGKTVEIN
jgi:uncharacterized protein involved in type VI secretion and phage assembly